MATTTDSGVASEPGRPSGQLSSVTFENYRAFEKFRLEGLTRVNLLVGRNNCGKTSLLEGLQLLKTSDPWAALAQTAMRRGEAISRGSRSERRTVIGVPQFFHNRQIEIGSQFAIRESSCRRGIRGQIDASAPTPESHGLNPGTKWPMFKMVLGDSGPTWTLPIETGTELASGVPLWGWPILPTSFELRDSLFIDINAANEIELAKGWSEVILRGKEDDVVSALRIIEPEISSVHFLPTGGSSVDDGSAASRIVVGLQGHRERVPIGALGEGIRRLLTLAIALSVTENACLLVDEIDTGIHYSVMSDLWKLVVHASRMLDIQVFATTHSWDCIAGLAELCADEPDLMDEVSIQKIDRGLDHSVAFTGESIVRMVRNDLDPR